MYYTHSWLALGSFARESRPPEPTQSTVPHTAPRANTESNTLIKLQLFESDWTQTLSMAAYTAALPLQ